MAEPASRNPKSTSCGIVSANVPKRLPAGFDDCSQINKIERLVGSATIPTVPMYGGDEEFSLHQRQQTYLPRQTGWPPATPRGLRPIGGNLFGGGSPFGARTPGDRIGGGVGGYSDILAAQRLWSSFITGLN
jgi:hypothetical protein